jgi:hypothetical protein
MPLKLTALPEAIDGLNLLQQLAFWPKEVKPTLAELASDVATLCHAATLFGDDTYILVEDFKSFFRQFRLHPSEWWKRTFLWTNQGSSASSMCFDSGWVIKQYCPTPCRRHHGSTVLTSRRHRRHSLCSRG